MAILMCHGLGSNKDNTSYLTLQTKLNASKITTFRIDLLGHGESDGEFDDLTLTETIDDILCAKQELERRGYTKIGFIGSSFGGVGGIIAASIEPLIF
jgi:esterase/lipase